MAIMNPIPDVPQVTTMIRAMYYLAFQKVPNHDMSAAMEMFGAVVECSNDGMKDIKQVTKREALYNLLSKICTTKSQ